MDTDVLRQNKIFQEIIQSCLTDVTFNKGTVKSSHAGSEERAGWGWAGQGTRALRVTCPRPGLSLWAANMVPSRESLPLPLNHRRMLAQLEIRSPFNFSH